MGEHLIEVVAYQTHHGITGDKGTKKKDILPNVSFLFSVFLYLGDRQKHIIGICIIEFYKVEIMIIICLYIGSGRKERNLSLIV